MASKICIKCGKRKSIGNFMKCKKHYLKNKNKTEYYYRGECLECYRVLSSYRYKAWLKNNRPKKNKYEREYVKKKIQSDIGFKIARNLRNRLWKVLRPKTIINSESAINLLGCTIKEFRKYFELQFADGMNWDRYLNGEIHIDHVRPCASYNLTDPEQQRQCFHYTNLQPLWARDNYSKGSKVASH